MAVRTKVDFSAWRGIKGNLNSGLKKAIKDSTLDLLDKSVNRAPINKDLQAETRGNLRNSGEASFGVEQGRIVGVVSFGGSLAQDYALIQHETPEFHHVDGEDKYLEKPYNENIQNYLKHIRNVLRGVLD